MSERDPIADLGAWLPMPSPPVFADPGAAHQIVLRCFDPSGRIMVSCNCLRYRSGPAGSHGGGGYRYRPLGVKVRWNPDDPMRLWRAHIRSVSETEHPGPGGGGTGPGC